MSLFLSSVNLLHEQNKVKIGIVVTMVLLAANGLAIKLVGVAE